MTGPAGRWALSPLDYRAHVVTDPTDDGPSGGLVARCGHAMPAGAVFEAVPRAALCAASRPQNYAGTSPITRASGTRRVVLARYARNRRLADALYAWAFSALNTSPGARAHYDTHRARRATHHQALRALGNRLVAILHGCLRHHTTHNEDTAWHSIKKEEPNAA